jgi:hypothetical protein
LLKKIQNQDKKIQNQEKILQNQEKKIQNQEKKIQNQEKDIKQLKIYKEKSIKDRKDYEEKIKNYDLKIKGQEKINKKNEKILKNTKLNLENIKLDYIKIEKELMLIKLRDPIKNFIELFSRALHVQTNSNLEDKVNIIKEEINNFNEKKSMFNEVIKNELINFFDKISLQIRYSNQMAHNIDYNKSIILQLFDYIDEFKEFNNLRNILNNEKLNKLLQQLAINRKNFVNEKLKYYQEEEKIYNKVKKIDDILD